MLQGEINLHSACFYFNINLWVYMVTGALVWVSCLYSVGVYHRHAMGDGCQLNVLLFKKRVFDIVVSLVALVGTAIITIPVAIAIKMADGGPIFYTQTRVDRRGKPFKMIKFRFQPERGEARGSGRQLRAELVHAGRHRVALLDGWSCVDP